MKISELEDVVRKFGAPTRWEKFKHLFGKCSMVWDENLHVEQWAKRGVGINDYAYSRTAQFGMCKICKKRETHYLC